jgi:hypothetical protein
MGKIVSGRNDLQCRYRYLQLVKWTEVAPKVDPAIVVKAAKIGQPTAEIAKGTSNSISITPFSGLDRLKVGRTVPMLSSFLESSLGPRTAPTQQCLHRVSPLLFVGKPREKQG